MTVLARLDDLTGENTPLHLAIGVFDGVHLGHQAVLQSARDHALAGGGSAMMVTFDPHPSQVLRPTETPKLLTSLPHKLALASALGVDRCLVVPFTPEFSRITAPHFLSAILSGGAPVRSVSVGRDWRFGKDRSGDLAALREIGTAHGFIVAGIPPRRIHGLTISSTGIRSLIDSGQLEEASLHLGRPYSILGPVEAGSQLGRSLGFPTANLLPLGLQVPPLGVYAGHGTLRGRTHFALANLGFRPTVSSSQDAVRLEVHLLDYPGPEFYGEDLEFAFFTHLRDEQKFPSLASLTAQIAQDAQRAREILAAPR